VRVGYVFRSMRLLRIFDQWSGSNMLFSFRFQLMGLNMTVRTTGSVLRLSRSKPLAVGMIGSRVCGLIGMRLWPISWLTTAAKKSSPGGSVRSWTPRTFPIPGGLRRRLA
jgi:hypothetical protein